MSGDRESLRHQVIGLGDQSIRKNYYPELQRSMADLERFWALIDESQDAILLVHAATGRITDANALARSLMGTHGTPPSELTISDIFAPQTSTQLLCWLEQGAGGQAVNETLTAQWPSALGEPLPVEMSVRVVGFSDEPYGVIVARDMTERLRIEALEREAVRRKDEYLAMLAHELRNPLAPIRNAAYMLGMGGLSMEKIQHQREVIERQVMHMSRLLDDLLDASRLTLGKIRLRKERLDLRQVVYRALEMVQASGRIGSRIISRTIPGKPLWIEGDAVRLEQVMANLLSNAIKYTPADGSIMITLDSFTTADSAGATPAPWARLTVRDTGVGIAPEILPHIFELFTQAEQSLDRAQGGLGIGLTLVHHLVTLHGGRVQAHSKGVGQGSEFTVELPLSEPVEQAAHPAMQPKPPESASDEPSGARNLRVLVVDDILDTAQSLSDLLGLWGYQIAVAMDGPQGLEQARTFRPHIILLDIGLPGMSGYEVAQRLRQDPDQQSLILIALTGYGPDQSRPWAKQTMFDQYFTKPVEAGLLRRTLDEYARELAPQAPADALHRAGS